MPKPIITLTTDFGLQDHFVGVMKGVILAITPGVEIVDITHQITPFEIAEAAFTIAEAFSYFPRTTVHIVVVDPGVGSARRPILAQTGGHRFLAPDNGVLSLVLERNKSTVREIKARKYMLPEISNTFHGRDVFAPAAAHLARGIAEGSLGRIITDPVQLSIARPQQTGRRFWSGAVLKIDRFGNIITNFHKNDFSGLASDGFEISAGVEKIARLRPNYAQAPFGEPFVIWGSSGYLEISVNQGNAARQLGVGMGAPVDLEVIV